MLIVALAVELLQQRAHSPHRARLDTVGQGAQARDP
jgi:hypothetical protein